MVEMMMTTTTTSTMKMMINEARVFKISTDLTYSNIDVAFQYLHLSEQSRYKGRFPSPDLTNDSHQTSIGHLQANAIRGNIGRT